MKPFAQRSLRPGSPCAQTRMARGSIDLVPALARAVGAVPVRRRAFVTGVHLPMIYVGGNTCVSVSIDSDVNNQGEDAQT